MNANEYQKVPDLDSMLSAFFKSEVPDPFPGLKLSGRAELPMPVASNKMRAERHSSIAKSRLSLAASVALLIGGCWYLSSQIGAPTERPGVGKGDLSAKIPKEILKAKDAKNATMP